MGVALVGAVVGARSEPGQRWIAGQIGSAVQGALAEGWTFATPELHWSFDGRVVLDHIELRAPDGHVVLGIRHAAIELVPSSLFDQHVEIRKVRIDGVDVHLGFDEDGALDLLEAFGGAGESDPNAPPYGGLPVEITVADLGLRDARFQMDGAESPQLALAGLDLRAAVRLPRGDPSVEVRDIALFGVLLQPDRLGLGIHGDVVWTGDGVQLDAVRLDAGPSHATISGTVLELSEGGVVDATLEAGPLDMGLVEQFTGAPMGGTYEGTLYARGPLGALGLWGTLRGVEGTEGALSLREGSVLCLPNTGGVHHEACRGEDFEHPVDETADLAWNVDLDADQFALEQLFPVITGAVVLDGHLKGRGYGVSWPEGVVVEEVVWEDGEELDIYGIRVRRIDGDLGIHEGVLHIDEAEIEGILGVSTGTGTLDFRDGAMDLQLQGALQPEMLEDLGVGDIGGRGTYRATVTGRIYDDGVPIDVRGSARMAPFTYGRDVRIDVVDASFAATVRDGVTNVGVSLTGQGGDAYGATFPDVDLPDLRVRVDDDLHVSGTAKLPVLQYDELVTLYDADAPFTWTQVGDAEPVLDLVATVGNQDLSGLLGNNGTAAVTLVGTRVDADIDFRWDDAPFLVAPDLVFDLGTMTLDLPSLVFGPTGRQRWTLERPLHLRLTEGGVADTDLALTSDLGRLEVVGTVGTAGPLASRITATGLDLDVLAELFPAGEGLDGDLDLSVTLSGDAADAHVDGEVSATGLFLPGALRWADLEGRFDLDDGELALDMALGTDGDTVVTVDGSLPVVADLGDLRPDPDGDGDVRVVVTAGSLKRFETLVPDLEMPLGEMSGELAVRGYVLDPELELRGIAKVALDGLDDLARIEFDAVREEGTLTAAVDAYDGFQRLAVVDAEAATQLSEVLRAALAGEALPDDQQELIALVVDDLDVDARELQLPLPTLMRLAGVDGDLRGRLGGVVHLAGSATRPVLRTDLDVVGVTGDQPFVGSLDIEPSSAGYTLGMDLGHSGDPWFRLAGTVPMAVDLQRDLADWGTGDWSLRASGTGLPVGLLEAFVDGLSAEDGRIAVTGGVTGPWMQPAPDLAVDADGIRGQFRPLGLNFRGGALHARAVQVEGWQPGDWSFIVDEFSLDTRPSYVGIETLSSLDTSRVEAKASVAFRSGALRDVEGSIDLTRAWLNAVDGQRIRVDTSSKRAPIRVSGVWPELLVQGGVAVTRGDLELNTSNLLADRTIRLDPVITVHRGSLDEPEERAPEPSVLDDMVVDLALDLGRSTEARLLVPVLDDLGAIGSSVTRADIEARLGGDLDILMDRGDISISGGVELLDGELALLNSRFDLGDSQLTFLGADYANPRLDIQGVMRVSGGELVVRLGGTAGSPRLELSSPDFGDAVEDLFAILLTGRSPDDLTSQEGAAAIEAVSGLLLQSVFAGGKIGQLEVAGDGTVTVGLPIARNVQVWGVVDPTPGLNENQFAVNGEWSILPRLVLDASYGDQESSLSLFWETRFDDIQPPKGRSRRDEE